jgi:hypothetical protein
MLQINQTTQLINRLSRAERAYAILMAAEFLFDVSNENNFYLKILLSPESCTYEECYHLYHKIESLKLYAEKSMPKHKRNMARLKTEFGIDSTNNDLEHSQLKYIGLLFWLARLSGNINPKAVLLANTACRNLIAEISPNDFDIDAPAISYFNNIEIAGKTMGIKAYSHKPEDLIDGALEIIRLH